MQWARKWLPHSVDWRKWIGVKPCLVANGGEAGGKSSSRRTWHLRRRPLGAQLTIGARLLWRRLRMADDALLWAFAPPPGVRGMTRLDRAKFDLELLVAALKVPSHTVNDLLKKLRKTDCLLSLPKVSFVARLEHADADFERCRLLLFNPTQVTRSDKRARLTEAIGAIVGSLILPDGSIDFQHYPIKLTYDNWPKDMLLRAVLHDADQSCVSSYSLIGHIVHVNLRNHLLPYKQLIGQVLLDKIPSCKTVVNKTNIIETEYRNFHMEVIAGEATFVTQTKENGCVFEMDFSKVFWNPRLGTEHERAVSLLKSDDIVYDVCAGIGPFVIAAMRSGRCRYALANDLNPTACEWLRRNVSLNGVGGERVQVHNMDAREFVRGAVEQDVRRLLAADYGGTVHVFINLPALALHLLDAFPGLLHRAPPPRLPFRIRLYCYCFAPAHLHAAQPLILSAAQRALSASLTAQQFTIHVVRDVSPKKWMYCLQVLVDLDVLTQAPSQWQHSPNQIAHNDCAQSDGCSKRARLDSDSSAAHTA